MKNKTIKLSSFIIFLGLVTYVFIKLSFPQYGGSIDKTLTYTVKKDTLNVDLTLSGQIKAVNFTSIGAPEIQTNDRLELMWIIKEGTYVQKGDTLAIFSDKAFKQREKDYENRLENEKLLLDKLKQQLITSKKKYELNIKQAKQGLVLAKTEYELSQFGSRLDKEKKKIALMKAEDAIIQIKADSSMSIKDIIRQINKKKNDIQNIESEIKKIKENIKQLHVIAPSEGLVVYKKIWKSGSRSPVRMGDKCWPGQGIIMLPDLSKIKDVVYVDEYDIGKIKKGMSATINLNAYSNHFYTGKITYISTLSSSDYDAKYEVNILIDKPDSLLKPGMSANTIIHIKKIPNALLIPIDAIIEKKGNFFVYDIDKQLKSIKIGDRNQDFVEIKSGLYEGDIILLTQTTVNTDDTKEKENK